MTARLSPEAALAFVRAQGIVLASAKGPVPRLIEAILGEPIAGNWWTHPHSSFIYNVLGEVSDSDDVLVCRLVQGKITLIHRRLWPALVRAAGHFEPSQLARVRDEHTRSGRHVSHETAFPSWVPEAVHREAASMNEHEALAALGPAALAPRVKSRASTKR